MKTSPESRLEHAVKNAKKNILQMIEMDDKNYAKI